MKLLFFISFIFFEFTVFGQSPCDNVKLYDQITVRGEKPIWQRLKQFDVKSIPAETMSKIKATMERTTSREFVSALKIRSVSIFDSLVARSWVQFNPPVIDNSSGNPINLFYAVLYETLLPDQTKFVFRVDFQKNGELVNEDQLAFYYGDDLGIKPCKDVVALVMTDSIQPIRSIEYMALVYNSNDMIIRWSVVAKQDPKTGTKYLRKWMQEQGILCSEAISMSPNRSERRELKIESSFRNRQLCNTNNISYVLNLVLIQNCFSISHQLNDPVLI